MGLIVISQAEYERLSAMIDRDSINVVISERSIREVALTLGMVEGEVEQLLSDFILTVDDPSFGEPDAVIEFTRASWRDTYGKDHGEDSYLIEKFKESLR